MIFLQEILPFPIFTSNDDIRLFFVWLGLTLIIVFNSIFINSFIKENKLKKKLKRRDKDVYK